MARRLINVHLEGGDLRPAECWDSGVPGLVITEGVTSHRALGLYSVTHEDSGTRISDLLWGSVESAKLFCSRIADITNWTDTFDNIRNSIPDGTSEKVNDIGTALQKELDADPSLILGVSGGTGHTT